MIKIPTGSKLMAWVIVFLGTALSVYLGDSIPFGTAVTFSTALYVNKQYQLRKQDEIK